MYFNTFNTTFIVDKNDLKRDYYEIAFLILSIFGLFANILNIAAIIYNPRGLTAHSKLIISLAVSDCCVALFGILRFTYHFLPWDVSYSSTSVCLWMFMKYFHQPSTVISSLLNLIALGVDQYIAIIKPLHYQTIMSSFNTNLIILSVWVVGLSIGLLEVIATLFTDYAMPPFVTYNFCLYVVNDSYQFVTWVIPYILVLLALCVILFLYTRIFIEYRKFIGRHQQFHPSELHNKKAIVTTLLVIGTFMICWVPISVYRLVHSFRLVKYSRNNAYTRTIFRTTSYILMVANVLCDPIIYGVRLPVVQEGYRRMYRKLQRRQSTSSQRTETEI